MTDKEILEFIDNLRARGVPSVVLKRGDFELQLGGIPPLRAGELPESHEARQAMLRDPGVPEEVKKRIREEDDRDLFASA